MTTVNIEHLLHRGDANLEFYCIDIGELAEFISLHPCSKGHSRNTVVTRAAMTSIIAATLNTTQASPILPAMVAVIFKVCTRREGSLPNFIRIFISGSQCRFIPCRGYPQIYNVCFQFLRPKNISVSGIKRGRVCKGRWIVMGAGR